MSRPYNRTGIKRESVVDYTREYNRRLYASRKAAGLCVACGEPAQEGKVRCAPCAKYQKQRWKIRAQDRKAKGLCAWCGMPANGKSVCPACMQKAVQRNAARRAKKAEVGE